MSVANARAWQQTFSRSPLWVTGVTVALLALGFNRSRLVVSQRRLHRSE